MRDVVEIARARRRQLSVEFTRYDEFLRVAEGLCALYSTAVPRARPDGACQRPNTHPHPSANAPASTQGLSPAPAKER